MSMSMRGLLLYVLGFSLPSCGIRSNPAPSSGGQEVQCPSGSANPGVKIRTTNCRTVVQFDADDFEASINVKSLVGAGVKDVEKTLRDISDAAEESQIQFSQTCELYNSCNLTSAEYRDRLDQAQAHFRSIREKVSLLESAGDNPEMLRTLLRELYIQTVPASTVANKTLALELSVQTATPSSEPRLVFPGETLHSGDTVVFGLRTSQDAYVYIFQRKASGKLDVLFPNPALSTMSNPIQGMRLVRIPPLGQAFQLDDKDLGLETVYVAASKVPLDDLQLALNSGNEPQMVSALTNLVAEGRPECPRSADLTIVSSSGCSSGTRGFTPTELRAKDEFFSQEASVQGLTAPGDSVVIRPFQFRHEN